MFQDSLEFTKKMEEGIEYVIEILNEESITEVLECISFLSSAYEFGAPNSEKGVQEMLTLVNRKEPAIKEAVNAAYKNLYLENSEKTSIKEKAVEVRLLKMFIDVNINIINKLLSLISNSFFNLVNFCNIYIENQEMNRKQAYTYSSP